MMTGEQVLAEAEQLALSSYSFDEWGRASPHFVSGYLSEKVASLESKLERANERIAQLEAQIDNYD